MEEKKQTPESVLQSKIRELATERNLPEFYKEDIDCDIRLVPKFKGLEKVLLLRGMGSQLFPLRIGADPVHVTHYTRNASGSSQKIEVYHIDVLGNIKPISFKKAEELVSEPPIMPTTRDANTFCECITELLRSSAEDKRIFGIFETPDIPFNDWKKWQAHFHSSGNEMMNNFLFQVLKRRKALKEFKPLKLVNKVAA